MGTAEGIAVAIFFLEVEIQCMVKYTSVYNYQPSWKPNLQHSWEVYQQNSKKVFKDTELYPDVRTV